MDTMASEKVAKRRRYGAELKARVVAECDAPGASVAKVAMAHGINANIVHGWRKRGIDERGAPRIESSADARPIPAAFIPIALPAQPAISAISAASAASATSAEIRIELSRKGTAVTVSWPISAALECGAWLREVLR
jgi:transposase